MKPYHELSQTIKHEVRNLEHLYHERSALQAEREQLRTERAVVADDLLDASNDASEISRLAIDLESKDRDLRRLEAIHTSLEKRIHTQEESFHELVPKACQTFTRLLNAFRSMVHERQVQRLRNLIHPSLRDQFEQSVEVLADATIEFQDVANIQIPSGGVWSLTRQLTPEAREETISFVRQTTVALTEQADELLTNLDKLGEAVQLPEFVLGPLPEPIPEPVIPPTMPTLEEEWQSPQERDYIMQLCSEAGRDFKTLSDSEKIVLQNSLANYRSQLQTSASRMGYTNWDGSQS
jgi:hypothetical protein